MKHVFETVDEAYARREPWGEPLVDEVIDALRKTRIITVQDVALLLGYEKRDLIGAIRIMTGVTLQQLVTGWRVRQARDLLQAEGIEIGSGSNATGKEGAMEALGLAEVPQEVLQRVAQRCGWRSYRVMKGILAREVSEGRL